MTPRLQAVLSCLGEAKVLYYKEPDVSDEIQLIIDSAKSSNAGRDEEALESRWAELMDSEGAVTVAQAIAHAVTVGAVLAFNHAADEKPW